MMPLFLSLLVPEKPMQPRSLRVAVLLLAACGLLPGKSEPGAAPAPAEDDGPPGLSLTHFAQTTELFVEFDSLVKGEESPFAAHLNDLTQFKPLASGKVIVILSGGGAPEERFEAAAPSVPGIFRPIAKPMHTGERRLTILVEGELQDKHELGAVTVFATIEDAKKAAPPEDGKPPIVFLKEQQWRMEFATAFVAERPLRAASLATGTLRAKPDGEALLSAPSSGRLITSGEGFPYIGMEVTKDQVLVSIAPKLSGDADSSSLTLDVTQAKIEVERAKKERERVESLFADSLVPQKKVDEAKLAEASAQAMLTAAQGRQGQFYGAQRGGGGGKISIRSPINGTVVKVSATPGAFLTEGEPLLQIVDLEKLWLEVQIPESEVGRARHATGAWFEVEGYEQPFEIKAETGGRVIALGGVIDPETRTAPLLFEFANPGKELRVGMFTEVRVLTGESKTALAIPTSAVLDENGENVVYIELEGEAFERRVVQLGVRDGDWVEVKAGLTAGDRLVTLGAYYIRLSASSGAIPAHGHAH